MIALTIERRAARLPLQLYRRALNGETKVAAFRNKTTGLLAAIVSPSAGSVEDAIQAAEDARAGVNLTGLFPDAFFATSAAMGRGLSLNGKNYLAASQPFKVWDADFAHAFGTGAYSIAGNGDIAAWRVWFNSPQAVVSGVTTGSILSVVMLARAAAASYIYVAARFINDAGGFVDNQVGTKSFTATGDLQEVWSDPVTVPAGATGVELWLWNGTAETHIVDVDCAVGDNHEPLRRLKWQSVPLRKIAADVSELNEAAGWLTDTFETVAPIERMDSIAVSVTSNIRRDEAFGTTGWGQVFDTPSGFETNAAYFGSIPRGATTKKWARIDAVLRSHATDPSLAAATVHAVASIAVDPDNDTLADVYALWRDPATGLPVTVSGMAARHGIAYQAFTATGVRATAGEAYGTVAGLTAVDSYYLTTGDLNTSTWVGYSGTPVLAMAAVLLDAPEQFMQFRMSAEAKASLDLGNLAAVPETANLGRLRKTRSKLTARKNGEAAQLKIALMGDSFSTTSAYYIANLAKLLIAVGGDGGVGFWGMGFPSTDSFGGDARGLYYGATTGTWTSNYHAGSTAPNISDARSSVAGSKILIRSISGATHPALSAVKLHYTPTADGVIRWRWTFAGSVGSWSANTNVQSGNTVDLTGFPTAALNVAALNEITLEIEVVSGSVILAGVDFQSATNGVVLHKLGSSGSQAGQWATASASANWRASIAALAPDLVTYMTGPNDQAADIPAATVAANVEAIIAAAKVTVSGLDVLLVAPPETPAGSLEAISMPVYAAALYDAATNAKAAWLDLQPAFGDADNTAEYASDGPVPLFLSDDVHPSIVGAVRGANVIASEYARVILG